MDFGRKLHRPWKLHRKLKLACRPLKKLTPTKLFVRILNPLFRMLSWPSRQRPYHPRQPRPREEYQDLAFMTLIVKVKPSKFGWEKKISRILRVCKDARFKMDQKGMVEISGIANPNMLLKKISKSRKIELCWYQFGQCSRYLSLPEPKEKPKENYDNSLHMYGGYPQHQTVPYELPGLACHPYFHPQQFHPYGPY